MKKAFRLFFVLSLVALLSACNSADYSNQTLVGKISEIDGNIITLELGDVKENELQFDGEAPQLPEDGELPEMNGEAPQMPRNGAPPEMNGERPEMPGNGTAPAEGEMPQFDGEAPQLPEDGELPEMNGEAPQMPGNGAPPEMNGDVMQSQTTYTFTASGETLKIDLESIGITLDDLTTESFVKVGDVIGVTFGSNNSIESVKFYTISE